MAPNQVGITSVSVPVLGLHYVCEAYFLKYMFNRCVSLKPMQLLYKIELVIKSNFLIQIKQKKN